MGKFLTTNTRRKRRASTAAAAAAVNKSSWMTPVNHGYHVVGEESYSNIWEEEKDNDSVVVQREQIEGIEFWFFGVFVPQIGDKVIKFMQTYFFDSNFKEVKIFQSFFLFFGCCCCCWV